MNKIKIILKKIMESKLLIKITYFLGFFIIICLIFQAGFFIGFKKASFGHDWGNNYNDNFGPSRRGYFMMEGGLGNKSDIPNAHGAIGRIIKTELPTIVVMDDKDKIEKVILINDSTQIRRMREEVKKEDLKIDDFVVVIGSPNSQGQIESRLIRVMPTDIKLGITPKI